jgi:LmbE family N-acetylglucosaminyl deacetylase
MDMEKRQTLLGVFAHPDDESFGPGGTLARYAAQGAAVHVIIATDGIAGSVADPAALQDHDTLAQVRSAELANAAAALKLTSIWSLPYRDSGMRNTPDNLHPDALIQQPLPTLVAELLGYIERLQPQVIVTHDPFGGYGHPDHIRVCEAVTAAFHIAANKVSQTNGSQTNGTGGLQKLYYTAADKRILRVMVRLMPLFRQNPMAVGRNKDINLVEISRWESPIHTVINIEKYLPDKLAASRAHTSQYGGGPSYFRLLPPALRLRLMSVENFTRAYPAPNGRLEQDLFEGIEV